MSDLDSSMFLSRRSLLVLSTLGLTKLAGTTDLVASGELQPSSRWTKVRSIVELKGEVRLKNEKVLMKGATKSAPIESVSTLEYEENAIRCDESFNGAFAYRKMLEAKVENRINQQTVNSKLRPDCQHIVLWLDGSDILSNCPDQPLTSMERDLIRGAVSSSFLDELLPQGGVRLGEKWDLPLESARRIFQLQSVENSTVQLKLLEADEEKGQLEIQGKVVGKAGDVATEITILGKGQVDRKRGLVTWLAANLQEKREIGEAEPGFQIEARLRLLRAPLEAPTSTETLASASKRARSADAAKLLHFESLPGGFRFLAEGEWYTLQDNSEVTVLRYVKNNSTIATCNLMRLPNLEPGRQVTIEGFQAMVGRSLGEAFREFEVSNEGLTENGLRMIRLVAAGEVQQVPVVWISILLSDDRGQRATLTFTMDRSMSDRFAGADQQLVGAFAFQDRVSPPSKVSKLSSDAKR